MILVCAVSGKKKALLTLVQIVLLSVGLFLGFKFIIAAIAIFWWVRKDSTIEINLGAGSYSYSILLKGIECEGIEFLMM